MSTEWPKRYRATLNGWAVARDATRKTGLDLACETRVAREVEKIAVTIEIYEDGRISIVEVSGPKVVLFAADGG